MRRILLTGSAGQLGYELQRTLASLGEVIPTNRQHLDLTRPESIRQVVQDVNPNVIVNAAAYTAVDKAESEPALANAVNAIAPKILAEEAQRLGSALIHISTDYVFDGRKNTPYTEQDRPNPINVYGQSKLAGEDKVRAVCDRHIIIRTGWIYGVYGKNNFVKTMLRLGAEQEKVSAVMDQIGAPTCGRDLAQAIARLLPRLDPGHPEQDILTGTYHLTNSGVASWYDYAATIIEEASAIGFPLRVKRILPITTPDHPTPVPRPAYSVLALEKVSAALGEPPIHWRQQLKHMLTRLYFKTYEGAYALNEKRVAEKFQTFST